MTEETLFRIATADKEIAECLRSIRGIGPKVTRDKIKV
jgi:hypothetical protein